VNLTLAGVFQSLQGESTRAGWPCTFVRVAGCNLRCRWCDTAYAWEGGESCAFEALVDRIDSLPRTRLLEITGGEPLLQSGAVALANHYAARGRDVLVETNGSLDIRVLDERVAAIVDMKGPSSGESPQMDLDNLSRLRGHDEVKFVVGGQEDYDFMRALLPRIDCARNAVNVSPLFGSLDAATLAGWLLRDGIDARLNLQLHKFIWDPEARDV
jgi:7-carboxy-7-deazaguanine synthase